MKPFYLTFLFLFFINFFYSQETKKYSVGEKIIYYNGNVWLDSEILKIDDNSNLFLIYADANKSQSLWVNYENIGKLEIKSSKEKVIETKTEIFQTVVAPKYRVSDIIYYNSGTRWILSEVMQVGPDYTYQVFSDTNKIGAIWVAEADMKLVKSTFVEKKVELITQKILYHEKDSVEFYFESTWSVGTINEINTEGYYQIKKTNNTILPQWFYFSDLRKIKKTPSSIKKDGAYVVGEVVFVYDGKEWIESEIIQINELGQYQIFYNSEKSITKWVDIKDLK